MAETQGNKVVSGDGRLVQFIRDPDEFQAPRQLDDAVGGPISPTSHHGTAVDRDGEADPIYAHAAVSGLISPNTHTGTDTEPEHHLAKLPKTGSYTDALQNHLSPSRPPINVTHFQSPYPQNGQMPQQISASPGASVHLRREVLAGHDGPARRPDQFTGSAGMAQSPQFSTRDLPATPPSHQLAHTHLFGADPTVAHASARDAYIEIVGDANGRDNEASGVVPPHLHGQLLSGERFAEPPKHWKQFEDTQAGYNLDKRMRKRRSVQGGLLGAITNPIGYAAAITLLFAFAITLFVVGVTFAAASNSDDAESFGDLGLYLGLPFMVFGAAFFIATAMSVRSHFMREDGTCLGGRMHSHKDFDVAPN